MTFWPTVCYCASCEARYGAEVGGDIPRIIDWTDPVWVGFQRKRQEWLVEFGQLVTDTFQRRKPGISVAHQSLAFHSGWVAGGSDALAGVTDWLSADLYGERYGLSFFAKLFYGLSTVRPFEHINSWNWPNIHEHVITRTEDDLRLTALSALMNHGAMVFIDAVDPVGTVHTRNYALGGRVYADVARYEQEVGGTFCQDVGIYYSFDSNVDLRENGLGVADAGYTFEDTGKGPSTPNAPRNPVVDLATTLIQHHVPFGAVTRKDLGRLSDWQVIILPNTLVLGPDEVQALRAYVEGGGSLLATRHASRITREGTSPGDFQLADLFGVSFAGETREIVTYVAPAGQHDELFAGFSAASPITVADTQLLVTAHPGTEVLATVTLPYTDPTDTRYASILTDPPGIATDHPAIVLHRHGRGTVIYSAGAIERWQHDTQQAVLLNLIRYLARRPFWVDLQAPKAVEATLFLQEERGRFVLNVINYQRELPNIPIHDLAIRVRLDGRTPAAVSLLPDRTALAHGVADDHVEFTISRVAGLRDGRDRPAVHRARGHPQHGRGHCLSRTSSAMDLTPTRPLWWYATYRLPLGRA